MSQVGVTPRPLTQGGIGSRVGLNLPPIQHPLSRLGSPEKLDVRGISRAGDRAESRVSGRPLGNETSYLSPRKLYSSQGRESKMSMMRRDLPANMYESIPEGVEVQLGDPTKTKMPIFGSRAGIASRGDLVSRAQSRLSTSGRQSAQARLEIDELEMLIREKTKGAHFADLRKKFKDNDPSGQGNVSREALNRIIVTLVNRPVNGSQFNRLMDRIGLKDKQVIGLPEFHACFRETGSSEYPRWMDPVRHFQDTKVTMTASQVHTQLKERAKQRFFDLADLIPQSNPGGASKLIKPEFRNALNKMMFFMEEDEFEKLWAKYDTDNYGTIDGQKLLNKLGINIQGKPGMATSPRLSPIDERNVPRKKEVERKQSLDIERWLKGKFREGCIAMREEFEQFDPNKTGTVTHDEFLATLTKFGLPLDKTLLEMFLARCQCKITREGVPYREFLHRFQDRSEGGMPHNILTNPKHQYNKDRDSAGNKSTLSAIETQLMHMFQKDFLALLGTFHKIDRHGTDVISQEEFRAAIESRFNLELTDAQFSNLIDRTPLDNVGHVMYADFMAQFDTRGTAPSLFVAVKEPERPQIIVREAPPRHASPIVDPVIDRLVLDETAAEETSHRSTKELMRTIKGHLCKDFQAVERAFLELDDLNSKQLTQEVFYGLLKQFDFKPEVTRGEIRDLWQTFIINKNKTLGWDEFVRHFGYNRRSATFPNAKISPPKKGDNDMMMRSRKLNCAADMLQDSLRSKIDYMWEDLRREFVEMDPYGTGFVSSEEFRDVLTELCVHLSDYELNMLTKKFDIKNDGRVSYIEFLKPFAMRKMVWRNGNNMLALLQHPQAELPLSDIGEPPQKGLTGITAKLRNKLSGEWKNLRRAFKKLDVNNEGYLSQPEFRSVLKLANVILDQDEVYHVMSQFDENLTGKISYKQFLKETFNPAKPRGSMVHRSI